MKGVPYGVFSGRMSLAVREEVQGRVRGGFVGWRTKVRCRPDAQSSSASC